jgi:hypothetical protein
MVLSMAERQRRIRRIRCATVIWMPTLLEVTNNGDEEERRLRILLPVMNW